MNDAPDPTIIRTPETMDRTNSRVLQQDLVPDVVKTRHMGEANRFIFSGLEADRPTGAQFHNSATVYFATDTNKLFIWTGTVWVSATLA